MRLWAWQILPYLSELQFRGQLREVVSVLHDLKNKGQTNHILINRVMDFSPRNLTSYFLKYREEYQNRYGKDISKEIVREFIEWGGGMPMIYEPFKGWHTKEYLRVCMANLYEKHVFGVGKSRISDKEWRRLVDGYKEITGEDWVI